MVIRIEFSKKFLYNIYRKWGEVRNMALFGEPTWPINSKSALIDYLGTAWVTLQLPVILAYLSKAEAVEDADELEALCNELGV